MSETGLLKRAKLGWNRRFSLARSPLFGGRCGGTRRTTRRGTSPPWERRGRTAGSRVLMPYYRCADCGLTSYSAAGHSTAKVCANCSTALPDGPELELRDEGYGGLLRPLSSLRAGGAVDGAHGRRPA